jgi:aminomethyltransferase
VSELKTTPLHAVHERLGARMVPFAGFDMPVQYASILQEHAAVRERAGLFDVSHMGQIWLDGPEAIATAERLVTCPVESLAPGRVRYGLLCNDDGGCVDDVTIYRQNEQSVLVCVNAANIDRDREWMQAHAPAGAGLADRSDDTGMLALQGPTSVAILTSLVADGDRARLAGLRRFRFDTFEVAGRAALVSATGYTGAPGFELYLYAGDTVAVFEALLEHGQAHGLEPAGLGARDTLRLEAALPLYGHELDDTTSPLEAGLGRFVKRERGGFIGAEAIERREAAGRTRQLVGFELEGKGIARAECTLHAKGEQVGVVTSGGPSPTLGKSIGLGYVPPALAAPGTPIQVRVRSREIEARVVETPFV